MPDKRIAAMIAAPTFAAAIVLTVAGCSSSGDSYPVADPSYSPYSYSPYSYSAPTYEDTSTYSDTSTYDDTSTYNDTSTYDDTSTQSTSEPYTADTCFNGPYITSTTSVSINDMNEVDCSSSDAHYKVIQTFLETTDLNKCNDVSDSQYAFSQSDTYGDSTIWSAVYCMVGLGSYANSGQ